MENNKTVTTVGRIMQICKEKKITLHKLESDLGFGNGYIRSLKKGSVPDNRLVRIARYLEVPVAYLYGDVKSPDDHSLTHWRELDGQELTLSEYEHIKKYRTLDEFGKKAVDSILSIESERTESEPEQTEPIQTKLIPLFGSSFAAGVAEPDFGNLWTDYEVPADSKADFAIRIVGKSMEPYLVDGSIALGQRRPPRIGEVVALEIDGEHVCKQYCEDSFGNLNLFSLNRDYPDLIVWKSGDQVVRGIGTILIDQKLPALPADINVG